MHARLTAQAAGPSHQCLRALSYQCRRTRPRRFYSSQNSGDKDEGDSQDVRHTRATVPQRQQDRGPFMNPQNDTEYGSQLVGSAGSATYDTVEQNAREEGELGEEDAKYDEVDVEGADEETAQLLKQLEEMGIDVNELDTNIEPNEDGELELNPDNEQLELIDELGDEEEMQAEARQFEPRETEEEDENRDPSLQRQLAFIEYQNQNEVRPVPFPVQPVTREAYLHSGLGTATLAGNNLEGVVQDRVQVLTELRSGGLRHAPSIARRMMRGGLVQFKSQEERDEVVREAALYASRIPVSAAARRKRLPREAKGEHGFAPLSDAAQRNLLDRHVRGLYVTNRYRRKADATASADLGKPFKGGEVLDHVVRTALKNATYLDRDTTVLAEKVRAVVAAGQAGSRRPPKQKQQPQKRQQQGKQAR